MRRFQGVAASLFACACAAGCGKTHTLADAPSGDSNTTDANTTPDAALAVTVTTYTRHVSAVGLDTGPPHTVQAGVPVYVVQPGGALGPMGNTDANGKISFLGVESGASITAVYMVQGAYKLVTTVGVKPGDNLVYGDVFGASHGTITAATMTVTFPSVSGATQYEVHHSCGDDVGNASPVTLNLSCDVTAGDMFLTATDDGGNLLATGTLHGTAYGPGQTAALAAWTAVTQPAATVSTSGLSAKVGSVTFQLSTIVDGLLFLSVNQSSPALTAGAGTTTINEPPGGDRLFAFEELYNTDAFGHKEAFQRLAPDTRTVTFTEPGLPWMGPVTWDAANQTVSWTTDGAGAYDGVILEVLWSSGATATTYYDWDVILPPGNSSFSWASPPTALAAYLPTVADAPYTNYAALIDLSNAADYDQLRQQPEWFLSNTGWATEDGELPTGSNIALTDGAEGYFPY